MNTLVDTIKEYDWRSSTAIPALTGRTPTGHPQAEMWLGAHPAGPSALIRSGVRRTLADVIADDAKLGSAVKERFGTRLPYLLKVIAVARPLSLQVHPSEGQARSGFSSGDANYVDRTGALTANSCLPCRAGHRDCGWPYRWSRSGSGTI
ncbi:type I phosphomannose isomerase catalytic subunit [Streptosporangium sp. NBC_01756]|uniref:type I phosphomannose isomerase catalytic subunit n=1 Tax=Streptosporangium sp. NBC_01756 TaxID=2975950 RepID=UPI002DDBA24B|nr:type I phosphomannose isomerase catalytic subunit [Streptosporangium sp. NBC_01756]WSC86753.1 hypothetical protein OIE48_00605 [Streptosporangium sp. NBC_01756]